MMNTDNNMLNEEEVLPVLAQQIYNLILRIKPGQDDIAQICAKTIVAIQKGDVCIAVSQQEQELLRQYPDIVQDAANEDPLLHHSPTFFILMNGLLYTRRNFLYEQNVIARLEALASRHTVNTNENCCGTMLPESFNEQQKNAGKLLMENDFCILSGGPGTGKTYTIGQIVARVLATNPTLNIKLAAPTGKAAQRLSESMASAIRSAREHSPEMAQALKEIPLFPSTTIHSLLKPNYDLVTFRHNADNPINADWLILDEASMIDLPLLSKLLDAIPDGCRLTLAGDKDQLASVERGRVFGDLCMRFSQHLACLHESRRFPSDGPIFSCAQAVNNGQYTLVQQLLDQQNQLEIPQIRTCFFNNARPYQPDTWNGFTNTCMNGFKRFLEARTAEEAFSCLNDYRVLCAFRNGPFGQIAINSFLKKLFTDHYGHDVPLPMMILKNDRNFSIFNGDVGIVMPNEPNVIIIPDENNSFRKLPLAAVSSAELSFAITVHKSQGSEYQNVAILLPEIDDSPLLSREILYTAITRTRENIALWTGRQALRHAVEHQTERMSGLPNAPVLNC